MNPIEANKKISEKVVFNNLKESREKQKPSYNLGQLVHQLGQLQQLLNESLAKR